MSIGVYPGTFNPPTIGHIAIVEAALAQHLLHSLDLVISRRPINKETLSVPTLEERLDVIRASVEHLYNVSVKVTDATLIAEIARGYDVVVMGADKWEQVNDVRYYASMEERDRAVRSLPRLVVARRGSGAAETAIPDGAALDLEGFEHISSSAARAGDWSQMTPAAQAFNERTGVWSG